MGQHSYQLIYLLRFHNSFPSERRLNRQPHPRSLHCHYYRRVNPTTAFNRDPSVGGKALRVVGAHHDQPWRKPLVDWFCDSRSILTSSVPSCVLHSDGTRVETGPLDARDTGPPEYRCVAGPAPWQDNGGLTSTASIALR